ncbi:MAG TPA: MBL fold metallo-hydrolase, partial [Polyangiaceae bacterium]
MTEQRALSKVSASLAKSQSAPSTPTARFVLARALFRLLLLIVPLALLLGWYSTSWGRAFGASASGADLERIQRSRHYSDGVFVNTLPTPMTTGSTWSMLWRWGFGTEARHPPGRLEFPGVEPATFAASPASGLRLTWLGHSTVLIEIDGQRVLTDPVFGQRTSPSRWLGPERFFAPPLALRDVPTLDAVVISHDHYDHLDYETIVALAPVTQKFFVPLGVAAHLKAWGVDSARVVELDWWQSALHAGLEFTATPARHFSGRGLTGGNRTQWAGWAIVGDQHRVFFTGDTGYFGEFAEIGERLGPFDASLVEAGAYDELWPNIHLGPENALRVHKDLRAKVLMPVHWGTFNLAFHAWSEPIERLRSLALTEHVKLAQPSPGESFELSK